MRARRSIRVLPGLGVLGALDAGGAPVERPAPSSFSIAILVLLAVATARPAPGETSVGGTISTSTTWTLAGSPYVLTNYVWVRGGERPVLTIEPGVVVRVGAGQLISIGDGGPGELRAIGTAEKPIVFTTAGEVAAGKWQGLSFGPQSGESRLEHGVVEGGGWYLSAGIRVQGSAPVLRGVTVRTTAHRGISVEAGSAPEITRSAVVGTTGGDGTGIHVSGGGRLTLADTAIRGSANGAIAVQPGAELHGLTGMVLTENGQDGVRHLGGELAVDETWRGFGYPYYLLNDYVRVRGAGRPVLTIEPGAVVKAGAQALISIGDGGPGELRAIGTAEKPIVFTTAGEVAAGKWQGLSFGPQSGESRLEHGVVEGGGWYLSAGIRVRGSAPVLRGVTVRTTAHRGISVEAGSAPEIMGSAVVGTTGGDGTGIHVSGGGRLTLADTVIRGSANGAIAVQPGAELNGLTGMVLTENGQDGVRHPGGELAVDETWRGFGYPYYLLNDYVRVRGAGRPVLTIEPGAVVKAGAQALISIGDGSPGELRAIGTAEKPIVFTTAGEVAAGKWQGLSFGPQSGESRLEHGVVEGGGWYLTAGIRVQGSAPVLRGVTVRTTAHRGISVEAGSAPEIKGSTVIGTTGGDGTGIDLSTQGVARIERTTVSGNAGAGIVNAGSHSRLRFVSIAGNGSDGVRNLSGALALRDGSVTGQAVPVRNSDPQLRSVDARQQWWGSGGGPMGLVGRVESDPWLAAPPTPEFAVTSLDASTRAFPPGASSTRFDAALPSTGQWAVIILAPDGSEARRYQGTGTEALVTWDGTSAAGALLPDGTYTVRFEATEASTGRVAAPLAGRLALDASLPVASLGWPAGSVRARAGDELTIEGSAGGPGFQSYVLEAGPGDLPAEWTVVDRGALPVSAGALGTWTTALLAPGRYTLRLSVTGASGKVATATARVDLFDDGECR